MTAGGEANSKKSTAAAKKQTNYRREQQYYQKISVFYIVLYCLYCSSRDHNFGFVSAEVPTDLVV